MTIIQTKHELIYREYLVLYRSHYKYVELYTVCIKSNTARFRSHKNPHTNRRQNYPNSHPLNNPKHNWRRRFHSCELIWMKTALMTISRGERHFLLWIWKFRALNVSLQAVIIGGRIRDIFPCRFIITQFRVSPRV